MSKTKDLNHYKLSVAELSKMYQRFKSASCSTNQLSLDLEQLLFHSLAQLDLQDLEQVKQSFIHSVPRPANWTLKEFPAHEKLELDPDNTQIHSSHKIIRF